MRREHHQRHEHEDPLAARLRAEYGNVSHSLVEAHVAALRDVRDEEDRLSSEHLARAEVASLAAHAARHQRGRR